MKGRGYANFKVASGTFPFVFILQFDRASGETVSDTQRYILKDFHIKIYSRLRRGDFGYTTILPNGCSYLILVRASDETILSTQRYFPKVFHVGENDSRLRRGGVA